MLCDKSRNVISFSLSRTVGSSDVAQQRFSGAKSISSDQFFGRSSGDPDFVSCSCDQLVRTCLIVYCNAEIFFTLVNFEHAYSIANIRWQYMEVVLSGHGYNELTIRINPRELSPQL